MNTRAMLEARRLRMRDWLYTVLMHRDGIVELNFGDGDDLPVMSACRGCGAEMTGTGEFCSASCVCGGEEPHVAEIGPRAVARFHLVDAQDFIF